MEEVYLKRVLTVSCLYFAADWESVVYIQDLFISLQSTSNLKGRLLDVWTYISLETATLLVRYCQHVTIAN